MTQIVVGEFRENKIKICVVVQIKILIRSNAATTQSECICLEKECDVLIYDIVFTNPKYYKENKKKRQLKGKNIDKRYNEGTSTKTIPCRAACRLKLQTVVRMSSRYYLRLIFSNFKGVGMSHTKKKKKVSKV